MAAVQLEPLLIRRARLLGGAVVDLRLVDGRIAALAPDLPAQSEERVIEAAGNTLLPGLHDHHIHLFATAAARDSIVCGPPRVNDEGELRRVLRERDSTGSGWLRGVGFHDSVCPELDRHWLDAVCPRRPLRIQHRSGMLWIYNTRALQALRLEPGEAWPEGAERGVDGEPNGRFYDLDAWLGQRLERSWPPLAPLSAALARCGVTGVTDAGARNGHAEWHALDRACQRGELGQRVLVMGTEALAGRPASVSGRLVVGPTKIYLREIDLPDLEQLTRRMATSHEQGRAVAVHCTTRVELAFALAALQDAGPGAGDRIEHASVADDALVDLMAELGVTAVPQPHFIAERGDQYLVDVEPEDIPCLYRGAAFLNRGVPLAAGSDAPYGAIDPWAAMKAAVQRRTEKGVVMGAEERLTPEQALALFTGDPCSPGDGARALAAGQPADLCLLDVPWERVRTDLDARHVALTIAGGRILHDNRYDGDTPTPK